MTLKFRNVNDAFYGLVRGFYNGEYPIVTKPSRVGEVIQIEEPVTIKYTHPRERVLFNTTRDANPFFHLYESLWMLAGRNDIAPLNYYSSGYSKQVQDGDSPYANGAYGYRWRQSYGGNGPTIRQSINGEWWERNGMCPVDQLEILINHLKANPYSRRAVLSMWNVEDDLLKIGTPIETTTAANKEFRTHKPDPNYSKDVCCNTQAYFSVESGVCQVCNGTGKLYAGGKSPSPFASTGRYETDTVVVCDRCKGLPSEVPRYLNMTVTNRSNDLIWGLLGANVVHFSFLQEYMAAALGLEVGYYYQFTNNLHVYTERWEPEKWLDYSNQSLNGPYNGNHFQPFPLVQDRETFDREVCFFTDNAWGNRVFELIEDRPFEEPFLERVAKPMCLAFASHKARDYPTALFHLGRIPAEDWRLACTNWITKRKTAWESKQAVAE